MDMQIVVHKAEEGGYWAEVSTMPGCATQGETIPELLRNLAEAVEGWESARLSERSLAKDWLRPEEDEAQRKL